MKNGFNKKNIFASVIFGILIVAACFIWGIYFLGGPLQEETVDSQKFAQTAEKQYYYIKETSWIRTFFEGGIISSNQIRFFEDGREIPAKMEILWPNLEHFDNINQTIITFFPADGSNPGFNGRHYTLTWSWLPGYFPLAVGLIFFLTGVNSLVILFWKRYALTETGEGVNHDSFGREFLTGTVIFIINIFILTTVFIIIGLTNKNLLDQSVVDSQIWPVFRFKPEQVEKTQFFFGIVLFPIISIISWFFLKQLRFIKDWLVNILFPIISLEITMAAGIFLHFALQRNSSFYIQGITLFQYPWALLGTLIFFFGLVFIEFRYPKKWIKWFLNSLIILSLLVVFIFIGFSVFTTEFDPFLHFHTPHFSAYTYSIDQIFKGKTINIDIQTQYGFYSYFLEPVFKLTGIGIYQIEGVVTFLQMIFFVIILFLVSRLVKSRLLFCCAVWVIPGTWLWMMNNVAQYENIYQYWPNRVIFPAIILLMIWFNQKVTEKYKKIVYMGTFLLCSIAVLWNFDTGIVALVAWMIFLVWDSIGNYHEYGLKKTLFNSSLAVVYTILALVFSFSMLYFYTYLRSGQFLDINKYFYYQSTFFGAGFFMLPLPTEIHMWNLVLLTYAIGLYWGINRMGNHLFHKKGLVDSQTKIRMNMIFMVAIMGCGLFAYYQGRSHDSNLLVTCWTFWFLIILYTDEIIQLLIKQYQEYPSLPGLLDKTGATVLGILLTAILFSYTGGIISITPGLVDRVEYNLSNMIRISQGTISEHARDVQLMKRNFKNNQEVVVLANYNQAYLYIESGTRNPLPIPSFSEIFSKTDYQNVVQYLTENKTDKIVMANNFSDDFPKLVEQVLKEYQIVEKGNYIGIYSPKGLK